MLILFDHGTPRGIARSLLGHTVLTAYEQGRDRLSNGELLSAAEEAGIDAMLTTGRRMRYRQNLKGRKIALVVLTGTTKWSRVGMYLDRIRAVIDAAEAGCHAEVEIPSQ